jgi:hypothetical protein
MGRTDGHVTTKRDSGSPLRNRQLDFITGRAEVAVICPRARSVEWIRCGYYIEAVRRYAAAGLGQRSVSMATPICFAIRGFLLLTDLV